jgi:murein L,D-transpeptidase YcbB/YkuD
VTLARFERLLASTAFGVVLALSSHAGMAQQSTQQSEPKAEVTLPIPDDSTAAQKASATPDASAPADSADTADTTEAKSDTSDTTPAADSAASDDAAAPKQDTAATDNTAEPKQDTASADSADQPAQDAAAPADADSAKDTAATDSADAPTQDAAAPADADNTKDAAATDNADAPKQDAAAPADVDSAKDTAATDNADAPKQDAAAPADADSAKDTAATGNAAEPDKAAAAPEAAPVRSALAEQLFELITGKRLDRYVTRKEDREGVEAFYQARDYKPLWISDGAANARAKAATGYLGQVETVGLNSSDYPTPDFSADVTPEDLAADELKMTNSVLTYARHAEIGQIHFSRVGADISFKLNPPDPAKVLEKLAGADDVAAALDSYNPPQKGFQALKKKLAELRANGGEIVKPKAEQNFVRIPNGRMLRPGMKDERVLLLRKRLKADGDKDSPRYDQDVVEAVKAFQTGADLKADGVVGPNTLAALNGEHALQREPNDPIDTVIVNMERWRWLPRHLGNDENTYVVVNVPDYTLTLYHDGKVDWKTRIVVGKPGKATPMTSAEMKYITVNPTWNVPPSIIENEYLPALAQDPTVLDRYGLRIYQDPDGTVHIYQPPGAGNALGRIRFNFPNKFLVYQHDTPDKYLFKRATRAYSHGCMRVQNPIEYAVKLLAIELPQDNYSQAKLKGMYGNSEININFPDPIPVHLTYQTAFVDQDGKLQFRDDIYRRDARMIRILKGKERRVADIPIERRPDSSARPVRMPVGTYAGYEGETYGYSSGPGFFDWLFGAGAPRQRYQPRYEPRYRFRPPRNVGPHAGNRPYYSRR